MWSYCESKTSLILSSPWLNMTACRPISVDQKDEASNVVNWGVPDPIYLRFSLFYYPRQPDRSWLPREKKKAGQKCLISYPTKRIHGLQPDPAVPGSLEHVQLHFPRLPL